MIFTRPAWLMQMMTFRNIEKSNLVIGENMQFQRVEWVIERIVWGIGALLIVAALLGVFGRGPLSSASARDSNGALEIEYPRLARWQAPLVLNVTLRRDADPGAPARVWIDRSYFENLRPESITPDPESVMISGDRIVYAFQADHADSLKVTFHFTTRSYGRLNGSVGLPGQPGVRFSHFIYP